MCVYGFINEGTLVENLILWLWTGNISIESGKVVFNFISRSRWYNKTLKGFHTFSKKNNFPFNDNLIEKDVINLRSN